MKDKPPVIMTRTRSGLIPANASSAAALEAIKPGKNVRIEVKRPRNPRMHDLYWSMVRVLAEGTGHSMENLHQVIKMGTGHVVVVETRSGVHTFPGSISFSAMDQEQFEEFFNKALEYVTTEIIPGLDQGDLMREIQTMMGENHAY